MKIVVIGGTGLIGSKTVAILRQGGHNVFAASPNTGVNTRSLARALRACNKPPKPDPRRRSSANGYGRGAASRSVVGSCRTALADSSTTATGWPTARFGSRVFSQLPGLGGTTRISLESCLCPIPVMKADSPSG
jgi:hypothetical protein